MYKKRIFNNIHIRYGILCTGVIDDNISVVFTNYLTFFSLQPQFVTQWGKTVFRMLWKWDSTFQLTSLKKKPKQSKAKQIGNICAEPNE